MSGPPPTVPVHEAVGLEKITRSTVSWSVCESHYMPEGSTINHDADRWYTANEGQLSECERCYINTIGCVEYRLSPEGRVKLPNNAYVRIDDVVSFDRILFTNYFYRPAIYKSNIARLGSRRKTCWCRPRSCGG